METLKKTSIVLSIFLLLGLFLAFYSPKQYSIFSCPNSPTTTTESKGFKEVDDLTVVLEKASEGNNKTVIIAVINKAYVDGVSGDVPTSVNMFHLFLEGFWLGEETRPLINHLVIVATDPTAYERCVFRGIVNCYLLVNQTDLEDGSDGPDFTAEKVYMSKGFINMMWRRTSFLLTVLKKGYNFIFTDTDVMWLRDPFTRVDTYGGDDIQFSTDRFNGDSKSDQNLINTGFYHVRSNSRTISLFERWYSMHDKSPGMKEQDVLQKLIRDDGILRELNLTATFFDTRYFSGFCQDSPDPSRVLTVHANCCRYINAKVKDLSSVLNDWKRLSMMNDTTLASFEWSPHVNCMDSWRH